MELMMSSQSTPLTTLKSSSHKITSKHQQFQFLAHRWKAQMKKIIPKGQDSTNQTLVHVVKEGETLTCIAKMYGVPIHGIAAANEDIRDLDLVFHGQHLNIPSSPSCHTKMARTTGYFLVLVPLIAFCIRCIMGALYNKVSGALEHHAANESEKHQSGSKRTRWEVALSDLNPDIMDAESRPDYDQLEDEDQLHFEDVSSSYTKLEHDYQKFLSECGMSKRGYWRGGSS